MQANEKGRCKWDWKVKKDLRFQQCSKQGWRSCHRRPKQCQECQPHHRDHRQPWHHSGSCNQWQWALWCKGRAVWQWTQQSRPCRRTTVSVPQHLSRVLEEGHGSPLQRTNPPQHHALPLQFPTTLLTLIKRRTWKRGLHKKKQPCVWLVWDEKGIYWGDGVTLEHLISAILEWKTKTNNKSNKLFGFGFAFTDLVPTVTMPPPTTSLPFICIFVFLSLFCHFVISVLNISYFTSFLSFLIIFQNEGKTFVGPFKILNIMHMFPKGFHNIFILNKLKKENKSLFVIGYIKTDAYDDFKMWILN